MPIRAVVFDAYGTLFDVHSVITRCNALFPGHGPALSQLWRQKQLEYTWLRSLMGRYDSFEAITEAALNHACASMRLVLSATGRSDLMQAYRRLNTYPEVADALAGLRDCRLAILSNGSPEMLAAVVRHASLERLLDYVISVEEVRIFKPHPNTYRLAVDKLQARIEAIAFVSSNYWDVCGAASFGFQAFWINRSKAAPDGLGARPKAVLDRLTDLVALIGMTGD
ncbi:MAG: haloacid dehalogenase type II [Betaproteobacteria bacterium]|nr:MAG: haloacid dehalogenase type II [Betaproteobacteria bacterium]